VGSADGLQLGDTVGAALGCIVILTVGASEGTEIKTGCEVGSQLG
jgi:hypothetical protein